MNYAEFSEGDVHMFPSIDGDGECVVCCECRIPEVTDWNVRLASLSDALLHLDIHVRRGHRVPCKAFDLIRKELDTEAKEVSAKRQMYRLFKDEDINEDTLLNKFEGFLLEYGLATEFAYYCHLENTENEFFST